MKALLPSLLFLAAGCLGARATEAVSDVFAIDLRDPVGTTESVSYAFGLETRNLGNSDSEGGGTFVLNTLGSAPIALEIVGPVSLAGDTTAEYRVLWNAGNTSLDVTDNARWRFLTGGPGNTGMVLNTFYAGQTTAPVTVSIVASYLGPTGQSLDSPPFSITIQPSLSTGLTSNRTNPNSGQVSLQTGVQNGSGTVVVNWDLDGDGQFDDATGPSVEVDYGSWTGTTRVKVEVIDGQGNRKIESRDVVLNKPPVSNQPVLEKPAWDPSGFTLHMPNPERDEFEFDANRREGGLVVIAHGLSSSVQATWMLEMGQAIEERCTREGIQKPNIALLDWSELAGDPSELPLWQKAMLKSVGLAGSLTGIKALNATEVAGNGINFLFDLYWVKEFGLLTGQQLANWMYLNGRLGGMPQIDTTRPMHLIGHSAGGFVVGEAARLLKHPAAGYSPILVDRVTFLDTPFVEKSHIALGDDNLPDPGVVERYISSIYGDLAFPTVNWVQEHAYYRRRMVLKSWSPFDTASPGSNGHGYAPIWYTENTIWDKQNPGKGMEDDGFALSPVLTRGVPQNAPLIALSEKNSKRRNPVEPYAAPPLPESAPPEGGLPDVDLVDWEVFGNASLQEGSWTLTELADAGIWKELAMPLTAQSLCFEFHYSQAGDGDFLAVHFGDAPVLYRAIDTELSRAAWLPVEIPLDLVSLDPGKLVFTLVSRGNPNAAVQIRNIRITQSDDVDADGLNFAQEQSAGTNSRFPDSDGDGLSDGQELETLLTDPLRADTDGDGQSDPSELGAGTDPRLAGSVFRVVSVLKDGDGFHLWWPAVAGKRYRVLRTTELGSGNFELLAHGVDASPPFNGWTDSEPPPARAFYWVEVE
jgi:hypothetical protein